MSVPTLKEGARLTIARIEEFRKEHHIPPMPNDEPWIAEANTALNAICDAAISALSTGHKECDTCGCYVATYTQEGIDAAKAEADRIHKGLRIE